jgi:hypothetical protein
VGDVERAFAAAPAPWEASIAGLDERAAAEELHGYRLVVAMVQTLIEAGEIDPLPLEPAARILHAVVGAAAMLITDAEPADQERASEESRAVVIRLAEACAAGEPAGRPQDWRAAAGRANVFDAAGVLA